MFKVPSHNKRENLAHNNLLKEEINCLLKLQVEWFVSQC